MGDEVSNSALVMTKAIGDMSIAVTKLATIVDFLSKDISEIKMDIKSLNGQFIARKEHEEFKAEVEKRFVGVESKKAFLSYLIPTITGIGGSILTFLFINYLQNLK